MWRWRRKRSAAAAATRALCRRCSSTCWTRCTPIFGGVERGPLHHLPHGCRQPVGAGAEPCARAMDDPPAARLPDRSGHPPGRSADAPREGRHADDGRSAHPDGRRGPDAALGQPDQRVRLDRRLHDRRVWRDRVRRRLSEDRPAGSSRPEAPLQDGLAGCRRHRRRRAAACARAAEPLQHPAHLSVLQESDSRTSAGSTCRLPSSCWWGRPTR